ncbi:MAG: hypothetical protein INQ03_01715 [Candidatus Heimdallarchaeota archaeon]|nr:hypothetical protein [Candidatus Heimdallarchaeota archaeon]
MLSDKSSFMVGEAIDRSFRKYYSHLVNPDQIVDFDENFRIYSGMPSPNNNLFFHDLIKPSELEPIIDETIQYFSEANSPFTWYVTNETINDSIIQILKKKKFRAFGQVFGVAANLDDLNKNFDTPNSLYVEAMKNNDKLEEWTRIGIVNYGLKTTQNEELTKRLQQYDFSDPSLPFKKYFAFLSGDPVAVSSLIYCDDVVAVFDDEIIPYYSKYDPFRLSVLYYPLIEARKKGYKVAVSVVETKKLSHYKIIGFTEIQKYHRFIYIPKKR